MPLPRFMVGACHLNDSMTPKATAVQPKKPLVHGSIPRLKADKLPTGFALPNLSIAFGGWPARLGLIC